ncbi:MAG: radical SAM protein [bacterium]|nr:radical SAM protein [bacterium]
MTINREEKKEKILLAFLPYWTPYIPPMGITTLKSYLQKFGYPVKTVDSNVKIGFKKLYEKYLDLLKSFIPEEKLGNFYNIGHGTLYNHMMTHLHSQQDEEYLELVKIMKYENYYVELTNEQAKQLNGVMDEFYEKLEEYLVDLIETEKPDIFGCTLYYGTLPASMFAFKLVRERYPHIKTAGGGGSFADHLTKDSPNFDRFLEKSEGYLDKIFIGQSQLLFIKWLQGELDESQRVFTLKDIGAVPLGVSTDVDVPDLSDLNVGDYIYLPAAGSRSCPFNCGFCNVKAFWGKHRVKNVNQTIHEMTELFKKYGNQLFFTLDSLLNSYITDLAKEFIKSDVSLYYIGYFKPCKQSCDVENTMLWRRGGFYRARLGVESGSQRMLDLINKGITVDQIRETIRCLAYAGIKTTAYWLVGYPGETEEDFQMTLDLIEELQNDIWESECNPFYYFYSGQEQGGEWSKRRRLLYPESSTDKLITQTWTLDIEPQREEVYRRMNRFVEHCDKLGIPNPYTIRELYEADERWKRLHKNAVPSIIELTDRKTYIDELKHLDQLVLTEELEEDDGDFNI